MKVTLAALAAVSLVLVGATAPVVAQGPDNYPTKPVRILVGFPPGQATDIIARAVAQKLGDMWGQQVIVDNRPGAAGIIASELAAKATPDGYTLLMSSSGPLAINTGLYAKLPYDPVKDYEPITVTASVPLVLVVNPSLPVTSLKELVALAKSKPGQLNYASGGSGVTNHLAMELFKSAAGLEINHIPYKGSTPALTDLIAGQVPFMFETGLATIPLIKAGKLRAIAVSSARRTVALPEVPTVAESGYRGFEAVAWVAFVAPAGIPAPVLSRLSADTLKILRMPDVRERFLGLGAEPVGNTPAEFRTYLRAEIAKWGKAVKDSGARVD